MEGGTYQMQDGMAAGFGLMFWLIFLAAYLFFAYCHFKVAQKAGCQSTAWFAYVPFLNIILMCQTARKSAWWFVAFLIPVVNLIAIGYLWAETAKNIGQPSFWGWLMFVPVVNVISLLVLAFAGAKPPQPTSPTQQPQPREPAGVA